MASSLDPREFVRVLAPAMAQAAAIGTALEGRVPNVPKPGAGSAVKAALTIADTAAQEVLLVPLLAGFTSAQLEAEEDTRSVARFRGDDAEARIVIDPIDGTLHFYLGAQGPYAVMAGLAIGGRYAASLVALPREGWLFEAVRGSGAHRARIEGATRELAEPAELTRAGSRVLLSDGVPDAVARRVEARGFAVQRACGGAVAVAPLLPGVRGGLRVAKQRTISTRGRIGLLIAAEAGALIETAQGAAFPDALDAPADVLVVASDAEVAAALRDALAG
jgi:fructose-1,6-bisphosphatase/inositol monophosphatase family enzyme